MRQGLRAVPLLLSFISCLFGSAAFAQTANNEECITKDISDYQWRVRHPADLPADIEVQPGSPMNKCFKLIGVGEYPLSLTGKGMAFSVNGSPFEKQKPVTVKEGDTIRVEHRAPDKFNVLWENRLEFRESDKERRRGLYRIVWITQTANNARKPETWRVGPGQQYRQLKEILPKVVAGDTIYLEPNAVYEPVDIRRVPGTKANPIHLIGDTDNASERPVFSGGTERFNWTLGLRHSHNWIVENVVLEDGGLCFRNESTNTVLKNVLVRRCATGILSTDRNSGNLTLDGVEVTQSGGKGRSWGHGVYVASDQHAYPGSQLVIKNSFLHDNKGNSIKSRFENSLIEGNWIESGTHREAKYLLELIGYDKKYDFSGQQFVVRGNTLLMRSPGLGSRTGGDGNSGSRGDTLYENNLFLIHEDFGRTIVRTFQGLRSVTMRNNAIAFIEDGRDTTLLTDEIPDSNWLEGHPLITLENNRITEDTKLLRRDETSEGDNRSAVTISGNKEMDPVVVSMETIAERRPKAGDYLSIKSF